MELHQLRYFVAAAETGSFTKAASREGVTQPSLSQAILRLEDSLDARLFDRLGRTIALTAAGHELLARAQVVLASVGDAEKAVRGSADGGTLRVGAIPTIAPYLLPEACRKFLKAHSSYRLELLEDRTERLLAAVVAGELDVAIMALPVRDERLHVETLFTESLRLAVPSQHRLAKAKSVRFADLVEEPFLILDELHCFGDQVWSLCQQQGGFEPKVVCHGEQIATLLALVAKGLGVTVVPEMAAAADTGPRAYVSFGSPPPSRTVCAVCHKHRFRPPAVRGFVELLK